MSSLQASSDSVPDLQSFRSTYTLAHDVRNPLTSINLSVEMLSSVIKDGESRLCLDIIMRSSARINELINEILKHQDR
jgi:signal transduction histidine kinase